jgi:hypothetical protein
MAKEKIKDDELVMLIPTVKDKKIFQVGEKPPKEYLDEFTEKGLVAPKSEVDKLMRPTYSNVEAENNGLKHELAEKDSRITAMAKMIDDLKNQIANLEANKTPVVPPLPTGIKPKK